MKAIVAADKNWAIGKGNDLLVKIPMDQKFSRQETSGHVVVMGRKTLESFPGGMPLKNRTNIVLTRRQDYDGKGALVVHSLEELLEELKKYPEDEIYVVGGGQIYELLLPYCNLIHVTKINFAYEADTYFPNLDQLPEWEVTASSEEQTYFDLEFEFLQYERKA